jgi:outer membrane receptor protein involved in Fe transport
MHGLSLMRRIMTGIMMVVAVVFAAASQPKARVEGRVYDSQTLESLPGATVLLQNDQGVATDEEGFYTLEAVAGSVVITFQYVGYRSVSRQLTLVPGELLLLDVGLEQHVTEMEQVVVSAGKVEQSLSELTVSLSIIKPEAFSSSHITDAQELINKSSGIEVLDGQASIRGGSGFSYGAGSRVMVLVDGLPMLSADAGHVKWQSLPLENLSQVEVIKGASSVLYGSSALNGIINFRTAAATKAGRTSFFAGAGVFGLPRQRDWVWWDTPRVFSSTSFSHLKRYGQTDVGLGGFMEYENGYRKLNDNRLGRANLFLRHRNTRLPGLSYGLASNLVSSRKRDFILWENADTGALKQDESTAQLLNGTTFTIDPSMQFDRGGTFTHDLRSRFQYTGNEFPDGGQNNSDARSVYAEYQFRYTASRLLSLSAGLMQYFSAITSNFYGDHHAWNQAVFSQADITPNDRLKLVAGVRLEHNTLDGVADKVVPLFRTGINYRLFDITFVRASFGQGYRYPSIAEKHAATTLGAVKIFPNIYVQPESGWSSELAVKQGIQTAYFDGLLDLAVFYSQNRDMIEYVFGIHADQLSDTYGMGFKSTNIEHSRVYGFELEMLLMAQSDLFNYTVNSGYTFMYPVEFDPQTRKNTGEYLKFRRKHAFNLTMGIAHRQFEAGLHLYARSRILSIDDVFVNPATREGILPGFFDYWTENNSGYVLADISFGYHLSPQYTLSVALKNVCNTEYMGRPGDIQPHRHVSLRISGSL